MAAFSDDLVIDNNQTVAFSTHSFVSKFDEIKLKEPLAQWQLNYELANPFFAAVRMGDPDIVKIFLAQKCDHIYSIQPGGLHVAILYNHIEIAKILLPYFDIHKANGDDITPFEAAKQEGHTPILKIFLIHELSQYKAELEGEIFRGKKHHHYLFKGNYSNLYGQIKAIDSLINNLNDEKSIVDRETLKILTEGEVGSIIKKYETLGVFPQSFYKANMANIIPNF